MTMHNLDEQWLASLPNLPEMEPIDRLLQSFFDEPTILQPEMSAFASENAVKVTYTIQDRSGKEWTLITRMNSAA